MTSRRYLYICWVQLTNNEVKELPFRTQIMKKLFIVIYISFLISGCNTLREFANVQKPDVRFSSMSVEDLSFRDVSLLFDFAITNPNNFGVSADQYRYEFLINGNDFVSGIQKKKLRIDQHSTSTIQIPVSLTFSEVFKTIGSIAGKDSMSYRLSTEVQFDIAGIGKQRVPVSTEGYFPIPKLPKIELGSFNVEEFSYSGAEMVVTLLIQNPNSFGISFADASYNLEVNGNEWLDTTLDRNINLDGSETEVISIPIRLHSSQMGSVLIDLLKGENELRYRINGSAKISANIEGFTGVETLPFNLSGTYRLD